MPNDNTNSPTKIRTFYKLPDLDARIAVYEHLGMLWFSFLSQGCSPNGTKRNPDHRKAQKALIPKLHEFMDHAMIVRYGKSTTPCEHFVADALPLARKGGNYRLDIAFPSPSDLLLEGIGCEAMDDIAALFGLVPVKNRPVKPAQV
jgi:hypothetical protein|tara:strand:+ start:1583 stop:2020 length:438 start_codon:yes stop_codon:yes gene_type:complete